MSCRFVFRGELFELKLDDIASKLATPSDVEIWNHVAVHLAQLAGWTITTTVSPAQTMRARLLSNTHPRVVELNSVTNGVDDAVEQPQRAENEKMIGDVRAAWASVEVVRKPLLPEVPLTHTIRYAVLAKDIEAAQRRFKSLVRSQARSARVSEDGEEVEQMRAAGAFAIRIVEPHDGPGNEPEPESDDNEPVRLPHERRVRARRNNPHELIDEVFVPRAM